MVSPALRTLFAEVAGRAEAATLAVRAGGEVEALGDPDRRYRIASLTKPFTALLAVDCLPLDARLRALLSHTTGLACELPGDLDVFEDCRAVLDAGVEPPRYARAGELWGYCNFGYWIAGALAAGACGRSFEEALAERVLEPIGLPDTGFDLGDGAVYPRARRPSGGLVSTASDLLRFADALAARADLRVPQARALGCEWGLGLRLDEGGVVGHLGAWEDYRSRLALVPASGVAVVVLVRGGASADVRRLSDAALAELAGVDARPPGPVEVEPAVVERHAGRYRMVDVELAVRVEEGGLLVEAPGEEPALGLPLSATAFAILEGPEAGERFDFPRPGLARFGPLAVRVA